MTGKILKLSPRTKAIVVATIFLSAALMWGLYLVFRPIFSAWDAFTASAAVVVILTVTYVAISLLSRSNFLGERRANLALQIVALVVLVGALVTGAGVILELHKARHAEQETKRIYREIADLRERAALETDQHGQIFQLIADRMRLLAPRLREPGRTHMLVGSKIYHDYGRHIQDATEAATSVTLAISNRELKNNYVRVLSLVEEGKGRMQTLMFYGENLEQHRSTYYNQLGRQDFPVIEAHVELVESIQAQCTRFKSHLELWAAVGKYVNFLSEHDEEWDFNASGAIVSDNPAISKQLSVHSLNMSLLHTGLVAQRQSAREADPVNRRDEN